MRPGGRHERRAPRGARVVVGIIVIASAPAPAHGQRPDIECDPSITATAAPGKLGYQKRRYGCEGMYIGLQSALHGVHVVSFVRGAIQYDLEKDRVLPVAVGVMPKHVRSLVQLVGRPRRANLHWAFHARVEGTNALPWDLTTVVKEVGLSSEAVGMYGVTQRTDGLGGPIYVPLQVGTAMNGDALELIVRVPAAGEVCWKVTEKQNVSKIPRRTGTCLQNEKAVRLDNNADGFFRILLPLPDSAGSSPMTEQRLLIHWRPRSQTGRQQPQGQDATPLGGPVYLSFLSW